MLKTSIIFVAGTMDTRAPFIVLKNAHTFMVTQCESPGGQCTNYAKRTLRYLCESR